MGNPIKQAQSRDAGMVDGRVVWARKSDVVWEAAFSRIEALEQGLLELADVVESSNPKGRATKLLAKLGIVKNG